MNYLITAAGHGSRFCQAGIKPPKPLIRIMGRELLLWSLSSFAIGPGDNLYIASQREHRVRKRMESLLKFLYPDTNIYWLELEEVLEGQLLTVVETIQKLEVTGPLVVHNCDTYHDATKVDFEKVLNAPECFGVIPCFYGEGDHWSFVRPSKIEPSIADQVTEKIRISEHCSVGTYAFSSSEKMAEMAQTYIDTHDDNTSEFYVAPFYQYAIEQGRTVKIMNAETTRLFGTPDELLSTFGISKNSLLAENAWDAHQRGTLVVDIDGTLCGGPVQGDYSLVKPIDDVCNALKVAHKKGIYIVLFTARNMRTFKGSLGLINKYTAPVLMDWLASNQIPYDEIYFGKPWGPNVGYVDDKSITIDSFITNHS
jgi:capsule biosynthesis phosphatase